MSTTGVNHELSFERDPQGVSAAEGAAFDTPVESKAAVQQGPSSEESSDDEEEYDWSEEERKLRATGWTPEEWYVSGSSDRSRQLAEEAEREWGKRHRQPRPRLPVSLSPLPFGLLSKLPTSVTRT